MTKKGLSFILIIAILLIASIFGQRFASPVREPSSTLPHSAFGILQVTDSPSSFSAVMGVQTKTSNCQINGPLPDPACTPGAIFPNVTRDQICTPGYTSSVRNVSQATKNKVFEEYSLPSTGHKAGEYEVDHLISLELGGSNEIANLFPEAADPRPGYHEKDKFENYLHDQVCFDNITLQQAQQEISQNWLKYWIDAGKP